MEQQTMNKMGTEPIGRLIPTMGLPVVLSMVLQAFYNIVDSAFVSNMAQNGEAALNALTLAFPVQMLMVAVSIGTGVGANALLARYLGQGEHEKVGKTAGNAIFLGVVISAVFFLFGIFGVKAYISTQTATPLIFDMAADYLQICCMGSLGIVFFAVFEKLLQSTGLTLYSTIAQVAGAVFNIVFDPILIYGLLGFPELGVRGAAWATVLGQLVSFLTALFFHLKYNKSVPNGLHYCKPSGTLIRGIYVIGFPAIVAQALMSVMTYGMNLILGRVDEALVTAYGLYYKIQQFVLFAAFGLRDTITPLVSFNFGLRDKTRMKQAIRYGTGYTLAIMLVGTVVLITFARPLSAVFGLSGTTQELCVDAMRIVSVSLLFAGLNVAFQGVFQALDGGAESLILSICRQLVFVLPVAWGFARLAISAPQYTWSVWLTFPIAEILTAVIACACMKRKMNHLA